MFFRVLRQVFGPKSKSKSVDQGAWKSLPPLVAEEVATTPFVESDFATMRIKKGDHKTFPLSESDRLRNSKICPEGKSVLVNLTSNRVLLYEQATDKVEDLTTALPPSASSELSRIVKPETHAALCTVEGKPVLIYPSQQDVTLFQLDSGIQRTICHPGSTQIFAASNTHVAYGSGEWAGFVTLQGEQKFEFRFSEKFWATYCSLDSSHLFVGGGFSSSDSSVSSRLYRIELSTGGASFIDSELHSPRCVLLGESKEAILLQEVRDENLYFADWSRNGRIYNFGSGFQLCGVYSGRYFFLEGRLLRLLSDLSCQISETVISEELLALCKADKDRVTGLCIRNRKLHIQDYHCSVVEKVDHKNANPFSFIPVGNPRYERLQAETRDWCDTDGRYEVSREMAVKPYRFSIHGDIVFMMTFAGVQLSRLQGGPFFKRELTEANYTRTDGGWWIASRQGQFFLSETGTLTKVEAAARTAEDERGSWFATSLEREIYYGWSSQDCPKASESLGFRVSNPNSSANHLCPNRDLLIVCSGSPDPTLKCYRLKPPPDASEVLWSKVLHGGSIHRSYLFSPDGHYVFAKPFLLDALTGDILDEVASLSHWVDNSTLCERRREGFRYYSWKQDNWSRHGPLDGSEDILFHRDHIGLFHPESSQLEIKRIELGAKT